MWAGVIRIQTECILHSAWFVYVPVYMYTPYTVSSTSGVPNPHPPTCSVWPAHMSPDKVVQCLALHPIKLEREPITGWVPSLRPYTSPLFPCCHFSPWRWRQHVSPKRRHPPVNPHGAKTQDFHNDSICWIVSIFKAKWQNVRRAGKYCRRCFWGRYCGLLQGAVTTQLPLPTR
jgi:hypothetical protein